VSAKSSRRKTVKETKIDKKRFEALKAEFATRGRQGSKYDPLIQRAAEGEYIELEPEEEMEPKVLAQGLSTARRKLGLKDKVDVRTLTKAGKVIIGPATAKPESTKPAPKK